MTNTTRTDAHRPSTLIPANYTSIVWYSLAHECEGWPQPPIGIDEVIAEQSAARDAGHKVYGSIGKCGVCGAVFKHGQLFAHTTGDLVHMGYDCADKYALLADRSAHEIALDRVHAATAKAMIREQNATERAEFLAAHDGLAEILAIGNASAAANGIEPSEWGTLKAHAILADLARNFVTYRTMSEKQIALATKLAAEITTPRAERATEIKIPALVGKGVKFTGEIVSAKLHESRGYGYNRDSVFTWKCTIKIATEAGVWLVWGSVPSALLDLVTESTAVQASYSRRTEGATTYAIARELRGLVVDVKATLEAGSDRECWYCHGTGADGDSAERVPCSKCNATGTIKADPSFAFMKRPTMTLANVHGPVQPKAPKARKNAAENTSDSEQM